MGKMKVFGESMNWSAHCRMAFLACHPCYPRSLSIGGTIKERVSRTLTWNKRLNLSTSKKIWDDPRKAPTSNFQFLTGSFNCLEDTPSYLRFGGQINIFIWQRVSEEVLIEYFRFKTSITFKRTQSFAVASAKARSCASNNLIWSLEIILKYLHRYFWNQAFNFFPPGVNGWTFPSSSSGFSSFLEPSLHAWGIEKTSGSSPTFCICRLELWFCFCSSLNPIWSLDFATRSLRLASTCFPWYWEFPFLLSSRLGNWNHESACFKSCQFKFSQCGSWSDIRLLV